MDQEWQGGSNIKMWSVERESKACRTIEFWYPKTTPQAGPASQKPLGDGRSLSYKELLYGNVLINRKAHSKWM